MSRRLTLYVGADLYARTPPEKLRAMGERMRAEMAEAGDPNAADPSADIVIRPYPEVEERAIVRRSPGDPRPRRKLKGRNRRRW